MAVWYSEMQLYTYFSFKPTAVGGIQVVLESIILKCIRNKTGGEWGRGGMIIVIVCVRFMMNIYIINIGCNAMPYSLK